MQRPWSRLMGHSLGVARSLGKASVPGFTKGLTAVTLCLFVLIVCMNFWSVAAASQASFCVNSCKSVAESYQWSPICWRACASVGWAALHVSAWPSYSWVSAGWQGLHAVTPQCLPAERKRCHQHPEGLERCFWCL